MSNISLKGVIDEDFVNYKVPSMTIMFPYCSFKCGENICQNSPLVREKTISIDIEALCDRYVNNKISEALVCQGLEPLDSFDELIMLIRCLRKRCDDYIVIYTGYEKQEIEKQIRELSQYKNIIIKYGRFFSNQKTHYDEILGVNLSSDNQYAEIIS